MSTEAPDTPRNIIVAMSGGVDSSVAALLEKRAGHHVEGVHLQLFSTDDDLAAFERAQSAVDSARRVAEKIGISLTVLDLRETFQKQVVRPFIEAYRRGLTPNPCCLCNPRIKLGALLDWALDQGADAVATGHYARIETYPMTGQPALRCAADPKKDQTYFLCHLGPKALAHFQTPVAKLDKATLRDLARRAELPVAERSDSQEICFIADDDYRRFLDEKMQEVGDAPPPGDIVDLDGKVLGSHDGIHHYTIGQRRGLGIGGSPEPLYVVAIRPEKKQVVIGPNDALFSSGLTTGKVVWSGLGEITEPTPVRVKIRYRSQAVAANLIPESDGTATITSGEPQRAVTPGQTVAIYDATGDWVLGGAEISGNK